jgi:hypothetical protein
LAPAEVACVLVASAAVALAPPGAAALQRAAVLLLPLLLLGSPRLPQKPRCPAGPLVGAWLQGAQQVLRQAQLVLEQLQEPLLVLALLTVQALVARCPCSSQYHAPLLYTRSQRGGLAMQGCAGTHQLHRQQHKEEARSVSNELGCNGTTD